MTVRMRCRVIVGWVLVMLKNIQQSIKRDSQEGAEEGYECEGLEHIFLGTKPGIWGSVIGTVAIVIVLGGEDEGS